MQSTCFQCVVVTHEWLLNSALRNSQKKRLARSTHLYNVVYRLETHKSLVPAVHKTAVFRKTKSFGAFCLFFLDSIDVWQFQSNYSKDSKSTVFNK